MPTLKINNFTGMVPRLPPERLPEGAAEYAANCDFAHGELRSLRGVGPKKSTTGVVRSLFTDGESGFFAWPTYTRAYLAPVIDDTWGRVYYNTEGQGLRGAQKSTMYDENANPRPPTVSYKIGVLAPSTGGAVTVNVLIDFEVVVDVMANGAVVRSVVIPQGQVATIVDWERYRITVPTDLFDGINTAAQPLAVSGGRIVGDAPIAFAAVVLVPGTAASEFQDTYETIGHTALAQRWDVDAAGTIRILDAQGAPVAVSDPVYGTLLSSFTAVTNVSYKENSFANGQMLYTSLQTGTASVTAQTTDISIRVKIWFRDTGAVFYDGRPSFVVDPVVANAYLLDIPPQVAGQRQTIAYAATAVNILGEESAPYGPALVDWRDNGTQTITLSTSYTPDPDQIPIAGILFYRTYPGSPTEYFLLNNTPVPVVAGTASLVDNSTGPLSVTTLQTQEWDEPPPNLKFLTYAGNGSFCAAVGKDLAFSEPYRPHAWPYRMLFPNTITGIIEVEGGVLVSTTEKPYYVSGSHPEQMSMQVINSDQAAISGRAMARVEGRAIYASNDGLVAASAGRASIESSQQLFTRNDWRDVFKTHFSKLSLAAWDGLLFGVIDGASTGHFIVRLDEAPGYSLLDVGSNLLGVAFSPTMDKTTLLYSDGFAEFGVGSPLALTWHSKEFEFPRAISFGAAIARFNGTFSLDIRKDGVSIHTQALSGSGETHFRLPAVGVGKQWQVRITGTGTIKSVELATLFAELQDV